ncbi:VOC family protein [Methylobacterium oryzihabitans]|uniref:VOC family protein n=1 Tax=Methylobacterium oryzihabitans TaxID=2499852 RepID=A0A3S2XJ14_9HYPH|nr:VOC family protein [Methylobacterium oryzihabitans]RVU15997.1 VOC family protein [Methylobacterium oryzihabitans]
MTASSAKPFVWYELMTTDPDAARDFYAAVIGWSARDWGGQGPRYTIMSAGERMVAGVMALPDEARAAGVPPCWIGSIAADDADAATDRLVAAGGRLLRAPEDIPGVGRFSVVADPGGGTFQLLATAEPPGPPSAPGAPGHVGWHELCAEDGGEAMAFYAGQFGWTADEALDMGPMGLYRLFSVDGRSSGGIMTRPPQVPMPGWLFYVTVPALDAAVARVGEAGGQVLMGPMQVPGGSWIARCLDPQGALFALTGPSR